MPTRRGWGLALTMVAIGVAGRALGVVELVMAAAAGLTLVAGAMAYVRLATVSLEVSRALRPPRRHAGASGDVEITVRNVTARASPSLALEDPFDHGRRRARFRVAPLRPGQAVNSTYQLPGQERGRYDLGPLQVRLADPFGMAATLVAAAPPTTLLVYPRIDVLGRLWPGPDGRDRSEPSPVAQPADGDLYVLREYHMGDDLRRVHWRSTAKHDEVMIRHDDVHRRHSTTVVLDLREEVHTSATLEEAVSAAASIVHAAWRRGRPVRLVTSDGTDSALAAGRAHAEAALERLACARTHRNPTLPSLLTPPDNGGGAGMLAVVTTGAAPEAVLSGPGRQRGPRVLVVVERSDGPAVERLSHPGTHLVRIGPGRPLSSAWAAAMEAGRGRAAGHR